MESGYQHPAMENAEHLLRDCDVRRTRASGPGGQHRNKVETAIVITHLPSGIVGQASERRSQDLNRQMAIQRLRVQLAIGIRIAVEPFTELTDLWQQRSVSGKLRVSSSHEDYPALLAESLDWAASLGWQIAPASERLGVSSSQLVKFWSEEPQALVYVNKQRAELGLGNLLAR